MRRKLRVHPGTPSSRRFSPALVFVALAVIVVVLAVGRVNDQSHVRSAELTGDALIDSLVELALSDLGTFVSEHAVERSGRLDRTSTADGLYRLASALDAVLLRAAPDSGDYVMAPTTIRDGADILQGTSRTAVQASVARGAFDVAAAAVTALQQQHYLHLERAAAEVTDAAHAVRPDTALDTQGAAVQQFFERAHDVLRGMAARGGGG